MLRTLGEELISNEIVALIELVKNAYDANATNVLIRFSGPVELGKGCIEVIDNGHGMDLETVKNVWMEPATPSKRGKLRRTEKFKRRFLGEKGIGRFASSRLAKEMEVISRKSNNNNEIYGLFDWEQFEDENKYLDEIIILWEERKPIEITHGGAIDLLWGKDESPTQKGKESGTILRMTNLKQKWEVQHFVDLRRALARLVFPKFAKKREEGKDPGFEVELSLPSEFSEFSSKIEPPPILKHPHYVIQGAVNPDGTFSISYKVLGEGIDKLLDGQFVRVKDAKGKFELRDIKSTTSSKEYKPTEIRLIECGHLDIELRVWDRDELGNVVQKTHSTIQDVRKDLDEVAGINIYRDGFRVFPYGEPQDDWLRLDLRRVQNPTLRLSNNQIYGVVHISADANPKLRDQSNREGLDENQAVQDLRDVMTEVLSRLEILRYTARPRAKNKNGKPVGGLFAGFDLKPLVDYFAKQFPQDKQVKELVEKTEQHFGSQLKEIQTVLARYQRLATLGQLIDHVLHEGRQPIASINSEAALGLEDVQCAEKPGDEFINKVAGRFTFIRKQGDVLAITFRRMEPFGGRRRGRPTPFYLEDIIKDAFCVFAEDIARLKVKVKLPRTQTLARVDPAEIQEIIINMTQNSLYWLEQINDSMREIEVIIDRNGSDHVDIIFSDNGPGIPPENRELIFEPYFSTKKDGVGLGLAIVGEIVSDYYGGSLELLKDGPLKGANFLITLRKRV